MPAADPGRLARHPEPPSRRNQFWHCSRTTRHLKTNQLLTASSLSPHRLSGRSHPPHSSLRMPHRPSLCPPGPPQRPAPKSSTLFRAPPPKPSRDRQGAVQHAAPIFHAKRTQSAGCARPVLSTSQQGRSRDSHGAGPRQRPRTQERGDRYGSIRASGFPNGCRYSIGAVLDHLLADLLAIRRSQIDAIDRRLAFGNALRHPNRHRVRHNHL